MQPLTFSMARAANLTWDWFRALSNQPSCSRHGEYIKQTLEAYRLQPVSRLSALTSVEEAESAQ